MKEKLAKYEAWILELESRQRTLATSRATYARLFAASLVLSFAGFFWNQWVGAGALLTGILFCIFGYYAIAVRQGDYERELKQTRREVARLRETATKPEGGSRA